MEAREFAADETAKLALPAAAVAEAARDEAMEVAADLALSIVALAAIDWLERVPDTFDATEGIACFKGRVPAPAMREKSVAALIPLSMIRRLMIRTQTRPKKRRAARMSNRSRVSAFCIVVMRVLEALSRPEKDVYWSDVRVRV